MTRWLWLPAILAALAAFAIGAALVVAVDMVSERRRWPRPEIWRMIDKLERRR